GWCGARRCIRYGYSGLKAQVNSAPGIAWGDNVPQQAAPCKGRLRDSQTESLLTWAFSPQSTLGSTHPRRCLGLN
ncbi:hypothetical protein LJC72_03210, partial [Bacteroides sp. OttesenSCG-928-D19]|nr:hypothetical protein [Bacteroides sp. OttesenSCG-928-D19]